METLGSRITYLRKTKKLTQSELMKELNINNLSRYETDQREPNISTIISLAHYFNVSIDWLLTGQEQQAILPEHDAYILNLYHQLSYEKQLKIEGILEYQVAETATQKQAMSSPSLTTDTSDLLA